MHILKLNFTHANATENHFGSDSQGTLAQALIRNTCQQQIKFVHCLWAIHDVAAYFSMRNQACECILPLLIHAYRHRNSELQWRNGCIYFLKSISCCIKIYQMGAKLNTYRPYKNSAHLLREERLTSSCNRHNKYVTFLKLGLIL